MSAERDLERVAARLRREERAGQAGTRMVRCPTHGPSYACPGATLYQRGYYLAAQPPDYWVATCGHIACRRILQHECPECDPA